MSEQVISLAPIVAANRKLALKRGEHQNIDTAQYHLASFDILRDGKTRHVEFGITVEAEMGWDVEALPQNINADAEVGTLVVYNNEAWVVIENNRNSGMDLITIAPYVDILRHLAGFTAQAAV
jgi:hypothetical protein